MTETSVATPTYNPGNPVGDTLDAVLGQSRTPDQVIVVDESSSDDTRRILLAGVASAGMAPSPAVLAGYADRGSTIRSANSGAPIARNFATGAAWRFLIAFCNSGDLRMLESLV